MVRLPRFKKLGEEVLTSDLEFGLALDVARASDAHASLSGHPERHGSLGGADAPAEGSLGKTVPLHIVNERFWAVPEYIHAAEY